MKRFRISIALFVLLLTVLIAVDPNDTFANVLKFGGLMKFKNSLNDGFVGYWTFDGKDVNWATGGVTDVSGNGNTGGVVGMSTTTNPVLGKIGQGMFFDGADDRMQVSSSGVNGLTAMTACAWVKPASTSAGYPVIFSTYDATAGWDIYLIDQGTTYGLGTSAKGGSATGYKEVTTSTITEGSWSHICTEQNGDTAANMKLFMNGRDVGSSATSDIGGGRTDDADNDAFVGQMYDMNTGSRYTGSIDDLRVYSRVLTDTEVAQLYKLGQNKFSVSPTSKGISLNQDLAGYWTFDGKDTNWTTTKTNDTSGSSVTGTMILMSTSTSPVIGKLGQGFRFDGVDDYVDLGNTLNSLAVPFTFAFWINTPGTASSFVIMESDKIGNANHSGFFAEIDSAEKIAMSYGDDTACGLSGRRSGISTNGITLNKWEHVVVVVRGATDMSFYIDGVDAGTAGYEGSGGAMVSGANNGAIGGDYNCGSTPAYLTGSLDDIRVYSRALTAADVKQLYSLGQGKTR